MAYQSLYRRYRPRRFSEVKGQDHVVRALRNAVRDGTVAHAYLFSGPRGTGKTSAARILAKALNCTNQTDGEPCGVCESCQAIQAGTSLDVNELDAASNNGVDAMRDLVGRVALGTAGRRKLYILDEVHMLTAGASNTLLKTLEEPPAHVVFVLATTDPQKVLPTIKSRTQHFEFRLLTAATLEEHLRWVVGDAGLEASDEAVELAIRRGAGSARDSLSALDQILAAGGVVDEETAIDEMVEALCERDTGRALVAVAAATDAGRDPRQLADLLLAHLRDAFLALMAKDLVALPDRAVDRVADQAHRLGPAATVRALDAVGEALTGMRDAPDPRILLEVALVRVTRPETDASLGALLERVERLERLLRKGAGPPAAAAPAADATGDARPDPVSAGGLPPVADAGPAADAARRALESASSPEPPPVAQAPAPPARQALGGVRGASRPRPDAPAGRPPDERPDEGPRGRAGAAPAVQGRSAGPAPRPAAAPPAASSAGTSSAAPPQAPTAPPSDRPVGAAGGALPSRDDLTLAWSDHVLGALRPGVKARFAVGRFVGVDGSAALLALPNQAHVEQCEPRKADVEAALAAHFGRPVPLRLVVDDGETAPPPGNRDAEPAAPQAAEEPVDLSELRDAPADDRTQIERLAEAFPGAQVIDDDR